MPTTRRASTPSLAEQLRQVPVPCPARSSSKSVAIKVFDKHHLISEMIDSPEMVDGLQNFLKEMSASPSLQSEAAARLAAIRFTVSYEPRNPPREEVQSFVVTDFPVYLLTASGLIASSTQDILDLLKLHQIPKRTQVARRLPGDQVTEFIALSPKATVEEDWKTITTLGIGIPGTYFIQNSQTSCRKVGIIKMQGFMTENLPMARRPVKILTVLKHELGHMFGLAHQENTVMNPAYDLNQPTNYSNDQLLIINRALDSLIQS